MCSNITAIIQMHFFLCVCKQTWNVLPKAYETTVFCLRALSLVWKSSELFHDNMRSAILGGRKPAWPAAAVSWHHVIILHVSWQGHCPGGFANLFVCTATTRICWPDPCKAEMMLHPRLKADRNRMRCRQKNVARCSQMFCLSIEY